MGRGGDEVEDRMIDESIAEPDLSVRFMCACFLRPSNRLGHIVITEVDGKSRGEWIYAVEVVPERKGEDGRGLYGRREKEGVSGGNDEMRRYARCMWVVVGDFVSLEGFGEIKLDGFQV